MTENKYEVGNVREKQVFSDLTEQAVDVMLKSMIDPAQIVLYLVIIVLTTLLVVLGIQVFFILRELRRAVSKTNKILEDAGIISESVSTPLATLSSLMMGIKTGVSVANLLKRVSKFGEKQMEDKKDGEVEKKPLIRRFFKGISRKGKSIGIS